MTDDSNGSDLFDMIDRAVSLYEQNKDSFKSLKGGSDGITIDDEDPLKQASVTDEQALVTVDVGTDEIQDIRLGLNGTTVEIGVGDTTITANVPADVNMDDASANLNNGVLEVIIPRTGGN